MMKSKLLVVIAVVTSMLTSLYVPSMAAGSDVVIFADSVLERAVRDNICKASGDITKDDVAGIRAIMLEVDRVSNLSGIENLTSLGSLKITDSQLSDLSPLASLPIYWLDFSNCQISNISTLANFSNLEFAYLKNNRISSVAPLMGLTKLAEVELTGNPVTEADVRSIPCGSIKFVAEAVAPTIVPTSTPVLTVAPTSTPIPVVTIAPTSTPVPTVAPTSTPIPVVTIVPTSTPVPTPTLIVTVAPTATPTPVVVVTPSPVVTVAPVVTVIPEVEVTPVVEQVTPAAISLYTVDEMVMSAEADKTSISLSWNESKNKKILGYNVYRNDMALTDFPITTTSYVDEKVVPGVDYTYSVEAIYSKKDFSKKSKAVSAKLTSETVIALNVDSTVVKVNGTEGTIDSQGSAPIVVDGRTVLPIRTIVESLGGTITWKGDTRVVTIKFRNSVIELVIDSNTAMVDGVTKTLDVPAMIKSNRTYIPLRFVAENLGCSIKWDPATKGIVISY